MSRGISTSRNISPLAPCLSQAGIAFACRYYSYTTNFAEKRLTHAEAQALLVQGIKLVTIYEDGPTDDTYFSTERGQRDGTHAHQFAVALGQPPDTAIYFAVDYDAPDKDLTLIAQYFAGVCHGLSVAGGGVARYAIGVYGSGLVCRLIKETRQLAAYAWLAESTGWAGHGNYAVPDLRQVIAGAALCGLAGGPKGGYEDNFADGDYGAFSTLQTGVTAEFLGLVKRLP